MDPGFGGGGLIINISNTLTDTTIMNMWLPSVFEIIAVNLELTCDGNCTNSVVFTRQAFSLRIR
jgi:hypothetical protein